MVGQKTVRCIKCNNIIDRELAVRLYEKQWMYKCNKCYSEHKRADNIVSCRKCKKKMPRSEAYRLYSYQFAYKCSECFGKHKFHKGGKK